MNLETEDNALAISLDAAAEAFREAMRETIKKYSLWYLIEGVLLIVCRT